MQICMMAGQVCG